MTDQAIVSWAFQVMVKPRGAICNLGCEYCYYLPKEELYPGSNFRMSKVLLEKFTRQYLDAHLSREVTFMWQGGEPTLMGLDFFRLAVEYQRRHRRPGQCIQNALQCNGTILNDEWCSFFKENDFLIGISLDGPPELHNQCRKDKGGKPTFDRVMHGLRVLKKHQVDVNVLACISAANVSHPLEVYHYLRDQVGARFIQFIPIVERTGKDNGRQEAAPTRHSIIGEQYGRFLNAVFDAWIQRDVGQVYVQIFDTALTHWLGLPGGLCAFAEKCGQALVLEHNGDLYSCDHFVEPGHRLGNITVTSLASLVGSEQQRRFAAHKRESLPSCCEECRVLFACNGGCPKDRIARPAQGEPGLNHLCAGYRAFFTHVDYPMRIMASLIRQGRAPSEVMHIMAASSPARQAMGAMV